MRGYRYRGNRARRFLRSFESLAKCRAHSVKQRKLDTIFEEEDEDNAPAAGEEGAAAALPAPLQFTAMTEELEGYFSNTAALAAFKEAILREPGLFRGAVVLDLTAGLGLFSLWAVRRAGARRAVVVVDHPEDARHAREFARQNNASARVTVVVGPIEEIELQEEKVHFILSDWMGDCLFSRSRLLSLLHARDKYLADSGLILPDKAALYLAAVTAPYDILEFWNEDVCGYDMSSARPLAVQDPDRLPIAKPVTDVCRLKTFDLYTLSPEEIPFDASFELSAVRSDWVHGFAVYFGVVFQHTRATDGRAVGFTDVPEKARCAVPYDLPPSTGGMPMVCMIDEPIGELRADQSRILGVFRVNFMDAELLEGMWMEVEFETRDDVGDDHVTGKQLYKLM